MKGQLSLVKDYMEKKDKILVLCVDRDNDIGEKTSLAGPIIGKENVIKSATQLGLADPEDSDFNALFSTVRMFEEMKNKYNTEIAVLTGDRNVGVTSDKNITEQLNTVLNRFNADYVILVTDGSEDEQIMPIIQSKVPILSVKRVIVKQSEQLESSYYKIKDFITESLDNPKFARLVFGLPAIAMILYALFGMEGWRIILGVVGIYFFIKGFKLEKYFTGTYEELRTSLTRRRFAFFMYIVAVAFIVLATFRGYTSMTEFIDIGFFETVSGYVSTSIYFYFIAGAAAWIGRNIGNKKRRGREVVAVIIFGFAVSMVIYNAAELIIMPQISALNFIISIILGFALVFIALYIELKS